MVDYSVRVSHLNRKQLMKKLGPLAPQNYDDKRLSTALAKVLKTDHPIHRKIQTFSKEQLHQICVILSLPTWNRDKGRRQKSVSTYFFREYPDAPLTNLNRILEEDACFAQLTSIVSLHYLIHKQNLNYFNFTKKICLKVI